jgi:tRNA nucleotidyltransferase (CCA-adding enzyme)
MADGDEFDAVVARVRERVTPDPEERARLRRVVGELRDRTERAVDDLPVATDAVDVVQVGSTARDTWLSGERDVDLFVRFPPDLDRADLQRYGLQVGHAVLPDGREEYAEHPYVHGEHEGFAVDLVPCYAVADATEIKSSVDRTPFHTRYLAERIDAETAGKIRVAKQFLSGVGVYGSDLQTRGFSGYLTELLVLAYGGFRGFVAAAADWHPPVELDPAEHGRGPETASPPARDGDAADSQFDDPLVVVDPTDPGRNVAAVCEASSVARLQHSARELLSTPRDSLFESADPEPLSAAAVRDAFADRGTTPVAVRFDAPDVVDDQLYPQLAKSLDGLAGGLDRRGFDVLRSAAWADETAVLLVELEVAARPAVERHEGPPVHVREHAEEFYGTYADDPDVYGPFVDGDRYVVERERPFETAAGFLHSDAVLDVALGVRVEDALTEGYDVLVGDEVADLAGEFATELARYVDPKPFQFSVAFSSTP